MNIRPLLYVRNRPFRRFCATLLIMTAAASACAHDFWIEPGAFRPAVGATVPLALHVGNDFKGDSAVFNPEFFNRYVVAGPGGEQPVAGAMGDDPAGTIKISRPGLYAVLYDSKKFDVTFDDFNKFQDYLKDEGLERHMTFAKARSGNGGKITEVYSRCAKALIAAPQGDAAPADRNFGCALELIAETNPYRSGNDELMLRLLFKNQPVEGVLVAAFNKADPTNKLKARTDKEGRVTFKLPRAGVWLVKAVHMTLLSRFVRGDWESYWASLTFEAAGPK